MHASSASFGKQTGGPTMSPGSLMQFTTYLFEKARLIRSTGSGSNPDTLTISRCDRTFSIVKAVFYPKRGVGPGCNSPMEFCAKIADGLKEMNGGMEMLWQLANFDFHDWLDGCVSSAFKNYGKERFWRYMWDPVMVDPDDPDNHVRVIYKTNLTDRATNTQAEFKPLRPAAPGATQKATDPLGIKFMLTVPSLDKDPGVEAWKKAGGAAAKEDDGGAESDNWNREKVEKDIKDYGAVHGFTVEQEYFSHTRATFKCPLIAEWRALFAFHAEHPTADSLPPMPIALNVSTATEARSMNLTGMPISWSQLWSKLAGRFPRPHHNRVEASAGSALTTSGSGADSLARSERMVAQNGEVAGTEPELPLELINNVTGINYSAGARQVARSQVRLRDSIAEMPLSAPTVEAGQLYFVAISEFEGEMRVGIGRKELEPGVEDGRAMVAWLQRSGWSNDPARRGFKWSGTPKLVVARRGLRQRGAAMRNTEPLSQFPPLSVTLSGNSSYYPDLPLSDSQQSLRLTKQSVDALREFCRQKRPELLRTAEEASATAAASRDERSCRKTSTSMDLDLEAGTAAAAEAADEAGATSDEPSLSDSSENDDSSDAAEVTPSSRKRDRDDADCGTEQIPKSSRPRRVRSAVVRFA
eukprot:3882786-Pleurochrysis_carterae.AAC.1